MEGLDSYIKEYMASPEFSCLVEKELDFTPPITLTYLIERLIITHIKLYVMENKVRDKNLTDAEIGQIKRKIDFWNGIQRPRLVEGIGEVLAKAVKEGNEALVKEPNSKDYKSR
jgi:hypothetical protein